MRLLFIPDVDAGDVVETSLDQFLEGRTDHEPATRPSEACIREALAMTGLIVAGGSPLWALGTIYAVAEYVDGPVWP